MLYMLLAPICKLDARVNRSPPLLIPYRIAYIRYEIYIHIYISDFVECKIMENCEWENCECTRKVSMETFGCLVKAICTMFVCSKAIQLQ